METTICGITAFNYWRIPPIVHLLLAGAGDDTTLQNIIGPDLLQAFRVRAFNELYLYKLFFSPNTRTRRLGATSQETRRVIPMLASNHMGPLDILASVRGQYHTSSLLRPHLWTGDIPLGGRVHLTDDIWMATPELILQQFAAHSSLTQLVMMGDELCGSFAVYSPPPLIRECLQRIHERRGIPKIAGWEPFVDGRGQLTNLWSRPPLTTPQTILRFAELSDARRGRLRLQQAAALMREGAASPFEVRAGILLGFPRRLGGEEFEDFTFNHKVALSREGKLLAQRQFCMCDLFWEEGNLDLECQSAVVHQEELSFLSDSDRCAALSYMGINVLPITYAQLRDAQRFAALAKTIARFLGTHPRKKTDTQTQRAEELHREVMGSWSRIHQLRSKSSSRNL